MFTKTRFYLNTPMYYPADKPFRSPVLDSLLGYVWCKEHGYEKTTSEEFVKNLVFPELPIKKAGKCYHSSSMFLPISKEDRRFVSCEYRVYPRKVMAQETMARVDPKQKLDEGREQFRAALVPYWTIMTPYVTFFADVTDITEFKQLVEQFAKYGNLGKKYGIGAGQIRKAEVSVVSYDYSVMKDGYATRPLPVKLFPDAKGPKEYTTYYAPYWCTKRSYPNKAICWMPKLEQYQVASASADDMEELMMNYAASKEAPLKEEEEYDV